jgi:hypothetical protein
MAAASVLFAAMLTASSVDSSLGVSLGYVEATTLRSVGVEE